MDPLTNASDFPVTVYGGTKSVVISTGTVIGGRNPFLGIAYVVVSGICVILGALFTATHLIKPRYGPLHHPIARYRGLPVDHHLGNSATIPTLRGTTTSPRPPQLVDDKRELAMTTREEEPVLDRCLNVVASQLVLSTVEQALRSHSGLRFRVS